MEKRWHNETHHTTDRSHTAYAGVLVSRIRRDFMHPPMYGISRSILATKTAEVLIEYD